MATHSISGLLALVALLVDLGLGLERLTLLRIECLPSLSKDLANLACRKQISQYRKETGNAS